MTDTSSSVLRYFSKFRLVVAPITADLSFCPLPCFTRTCHPEPLLRSDDAVGPSRREGFDSTAVGRRALPPFVIGNRLDIEDEVVGVGAPGHGANLG